MKRIFALLKTWAQKLRNYISPVFLALLAVSFTLWYISKLNYTYTTDFNIKVKVEGQRIVVPCVVEGKGTNLFGYVLSTSRLNIPLSELEYSVMREVTELSSVPSDKMRLHIKPESLKNAISVRLSDINIRSVGSIPDIEMPKDM